MMDVRWLAEIPPWEWPSDAGPLLLEVLRDRSAEDRVLAASRASSTVVMDDELALTLLSIGEAPEEEEEEGLREMAAISLGPALEEADLDLAFPGDPEEDAVSPRTLASIRRRLRAVYVDAEAPKHVRRRALEASVRAPEDWHDGAIRAACHSGDAEWRATAVFHGPPPRIRGGDPRGRGEWGARPAVRGRPGRGDAGDPGGLAPREAAAPLAGR